MPRTKPPALPVRGTPGGWRDVWDDPDDSAELRAGAEIAERQLAERAQALGEGWREEIRAERRAGRRAA